MVAQLAISMAEMVQETQGLQSQKEAAAATAQADAAKAMEMVAVAQGRETELQEEVRCLYVYI